MRMTSGNFEIRAPLRAFLMHFGCFGGKKVSRIMPDIFQLNIQRINKT